MLEKEPSLTPKYGIDLEEYWYEIRLGIAWALQDYPFICDNCGARCRSITRVNSPLCIYVCNLCAIFR